MRLVLSAQMGKAGPPMHGKDLHVGDFACGILPAAAPLAIGSLTMAGMALAFARDGSGRVALSFIGEGGSSLGEWHEAINLCAARRLPAVFAVENNQTALSTPVREQSAVARLCRQGRRATAFPASRSTAPTPTRSRRRSRGPSSARARGGARRSSSSSRCACAGTRITTTCSISARTRSRAGSIRRSSETGYANPDLYAFWSARDPIPAYAARLQAEELIDGEELDRLKAECEAIVEFEAQEVIAAAWPPARQAGEGVFAGEAPRQRVEVLDPQVRLHLDTDPPLPPLERLDAGGSIEHGGSTLLEAVMLGVGDALRADPSVFVFGEDVGGSYGNAFLLLRPLLEEFGDRILNSPLAEGAVLGACVGAALAGQRPIGEMQFNDFVATGFNQLVNNAAKIRYRWGGSVPMVVRMPWGGLRHAGPYHSQNTEPWFYRTPGLKIVVPSTPADARALMASAVADPDPVLYYEHIALYRDPRIKQVLAAEPPAADCRSAAPRCGAKATISSSFPTAPTCMPRCASPSGSRPIGIQASVLDLRSLAPLDRDAVLACARHCSRVLIVHEDSRTGGIGESLAAIIQEEAFESLDAPVRILAALDTPVPYSPPLEAAFLPSDDEIERAARLLVALRELSWQSTLIAKKIAIVLQTPRDQQSSVLLTYQDLADELARRGHLVTIVTPDDFPASRRAAGRLTPLVYPFVVQGWMRQHGVGCDVVVFHSYSGWRAVSTAAARGVPAVIAFHGLEPLYHQALREESADAGGLSWRYRLLQEWLMPFMLRSACRHAARVTCLNSIERDELVAPRLGHRRSRRPRLSRRAAGVLSAGAAASSGAHAALCRAVAADEGRRVSARGFHRSSPIAMPT